MDISLVKPITAALLFSMLGLVLFVLSFVIFDKLTPGNMWKEIIEEKNAALAILCAGFAIGMSIIIAFAIKG
jgi:putative membrane protein